MIGQYPGALFNPWYVDKLFEILVIFLIDEPRQVGPVGVYRTTQIFEGDCQVLSPCQEFPENIVSGVKMFSDIFFIPGQPGCRFVS